MDLMVYTKIDCPCGQQYEFDIETLPTEFLCGVCRQLVKMPDPEILKNRLSDFVGTTAKSKSRKSKGRKKL